MTPAPCASDERGEHLADDADHARLGQRPLAAEDLVQVLPGDELHGDEERAVVGLAEVQDADGVGVVEAAGRLGLALEPGDGALVRQQRWRSTLSTTGLSRASWLAR